MEDAPNPKHAPVKVKLVIVVPNCEMDLFVFSASKLNKRSKKKDLVKPKPMEDQDIIYDGDFPRRKRGRPKC